MTEAELSEAAGLVARFKLGHLYGVSPDAKWEIQLRLLVLGVTLDDPMPAPDPTAPDGGTALRQAA